jgi:hypothetical protein
MSETNGSTPPGGQPLGNVLGVQWTKVNMNWSWLHANSEDGEFILLLMDTPIGRLGFAFTREDLANFIRTAQAQTSGLVLPPPTQMPPL